MAFAAPAVDMKASAPQADIALPQPATADAVAAEPAGPAAAEPEPAVPERPEIAEAQPSKIETAIPSAPVHARGGWLIQIGAFDDEDQAKQHLTDAQSKVRAALAAKDPFTERIQKGDKALYRARFAGFDKATAEAACRQLKRSDFECMAVKD